MRRRNHLSLAVSPDDRVNAVGEFMRAEAEDCVNRRCVAVGVMKVYEDGSYDGAFVGEASDQPALHMALQRVGLRMVAPEMFPDDE